MSVGTELGRRVGALGCGTGRFSGRFIWVQKGSLSMFKTLVTVSILSGLFLSSAVQIVRQALSERAEAARVPAEASGAAGAAGDD